MAIQKKENFRGVEADYWRVARINAHIDSGTAEVTCALYMNEVTRRASVDNALTERRFTLPIASLNLTNKDLVAVVYTALNACNLLVGEQV